MAKLNVPMSEDEANCEHEWDTHISSMSSNEYFEDVFCRKCKVEGQRDCETYEVTWPCT